jgi:glycosyltransferase involved in cell wall biosynthesis
MTLAEERSEEWMGAPRVAFFTDSLLEVNGVAHTSRHFTAFAERRNLPLMNVHAGMHTEVTQEGTVWRCQLKRGPARLGPGNDVSFDPFFMKHRRKLAEALKDFGAEIIHITGPSDVGILGSMLAKDLGLPLVASWHTNVHEFAARRLMKRLSMMPSGMRRKAADATEKAVLEMCLKLYRRAHTVFAPNDELVEMMAVGTGRPAYLMVRGVDTDLFSPERRRRPIGELKIGYVGRLSPEKSVRRLLDIETQLLGAGIKDFKLVIVGEGNERPWLESHLRHAEFRGVLTGEALADAYADLDIFVFPSHTDTFGNVVLEAAASGLPVVVTASGGPKFMVRDGVTGFISSKDEEFAQHVVQLAQYPAFMRAMGARGREQALSWSWDQVFERIYAIYGSVLGREAVDANCVAS